MIVALLALTLRWLGAHHFNADRPRSGAMMLSLFVIGLAATTLLGFVGMNAFAWILFIPVGAWALTDCAKTFLGLAEDGNDKCIVAWKVPLFSKDMS